MGALIIITAYVVGRFSVFQHETLKSIQEVSNALTEANEQLELKVQQRTKELSDANQHLRFLATHDHLTGLPNRVLFFDRLEQTIKKARRQKQRFALFFIDLDDFKRINDSFGHAIGDRVLQTVANFLNDTIRDSDTVARLSGDEFTIILDNVQNRSNVELIAQKTLQAVSQPIHISQEKIVMTICIGISLFPDDSEDAETLFRRADAAMYQVKKEGKNSYLIYENGDD
jgi:diguanylate cyclase (GGDEF)-like protein